MSDPVARRIENALRAPSSDGRSDYQFSRKERTSWLFYLLIRPQAYNPAAAPEDQAH